MPVPSTWRLIIDHAREGPMNMAIDEAILVAVANEKVPPTLRFYAWDPPTISIGYFQSLEREVDLARCKNAGFGVVRRPTGGRAVLHDDEVTYSIVIKEKDFPGTVVETYKRLSTGLVNGLCRLGVEAEMQAHAPQKERSSAACFDSPSWYEVVCRGKKIIGSAQVRKMGTILQHGSIPVTFSPDRVVNVLMLPSDAARQRLVRHLSQKAAGLADFLPERPSFADVCRALTEGLSETLGVLFVSGCLTPEEQQMAEQIMAEKYSVDDWNLKR